jgi:hypothetical protein
VPKAFVGKKVTIQVKFNLAPFETVPASMEVDTGKK